MPREKVPYYVRAIKQGEEEVDFVDTFAAVPRIMLAGMETGDFVKKIALGLLAIWREKGVQAVPFSIGPEYHNLESYRAAAGTPCYTLDSFYQDEQELAYILTHYTESKDLGLLISTNSYYDTMMPYNFNWTEHREVPQGSAADLAEKTDTPVIMVLDLGGDSFTNLVKIEGILNFRNDQQIAGFILVGDNYKELEGMRNMVEAEFGMPVFGLFADQHSMEGPSLYQVIPELKKDSWEKNLHDVSSAVLNSLDITSILRLARKASDLGEEFPADLFQAQKMIGFDGAKRFNLAVARDEAFNEYYQENLDMLEEMGANIIYFSPLADPILPRKVDGIYLGPGDLVGNLAQISKNESLRSQILKLASEGLPILAEGSGTIYLADSYISNQGAEWPLVGVLPSKVRSRKDKVKRYYAKMTSRREDLLCQTNDSIRCFLGNEYIFEPNGASYRALIKGEGHHMECFSTRTVWACQARLHFYAIPGSIARFALTCMGN